MMWRYHNGELELLEKQRIWVENALKLGFSWWKCIASKQRSLLYLLRFYVAEQMKIGEMDRSCYLGGYQHTDLHVDAPFGHLLLCQRHSTI